MRGGVAAPYRCRVRPVPGPPPGRVGGEMVRLRRHDRRGRRGHPGSAVQHLPPADRRERVGSERQHRGERLDRRALPGTCVLGHRGVHAAVLHLHPTRYGARAAALPLPHARRRAPERPRGRVSGRSVCLGVSAHRIWMGEEEIHVTCAVAFGLLAYVAATGDQALMTDYGAEILFETARFWADRLEPMPDGRYALSRVVGPDEFHEHVDNSAYTNYLVRWHLRQAAHVYADLAAHHPRELTDLSGRIGLTADEAREWLDRADRIRLPVQTDDGVIEQFDGYFGLESLAVTLDHNDMPQYPPGYHHYNLGGTKLLKQADVVMLTYVLPDEFAAPVKHANYEYYEPLT